MWNCVVCHFFIQKCWARYFIIQKWQALCFLLKNVNFVSFIRNCLVSFEFFYFSFETAEFTTFPFKRGELATFKPAKFTTFILKKDVFSTVLKDAFKLKLSSLKSQSRVADRSYSKSPTIAQLRSGKQKLLHQTSRQIIQRSILGPLWFNIFLSYNILFAEKSEICNFNKNIFVSFIISLRKQKEKVISWN